MFEGDNNSQSQIRLSQMMNDGDNDSPENAKEAPQCEERGCQTEAEPEKQAVEVQTADCATQDSGTNPEQTETVDSQTQHETAMQEGCCQYESSVRESESQTPQIGQANIETQTEEDVADGVECSA